MGRLKDLKPNTVQVLLEQYLHVCIGVRKSGKTTLFRDLIHTRYNGDMTKGLLIPFEIGFKALDGIIPTDPFDSWSEFENMVDELIIDKEELPYRFLCIDTIDEMVVMAENEAIRFYNSRVEPSKRAKTLNEVGGGFGKGKAYTKQLIRKVLNKLLKAGYGLFLIGHSKEKTIKEKDGTEYGQLSCSLTNDYTDILLDMADIISFLTIEKEIVNEVITNKKVFMNFRSDGSIDCGGRLKGLPDRVEYGAENYISVFETGVKASMIKPITDMDKETKKQEKEFENKSKNNIKKMVELPQAISSIKDVMKKKLKSGAIDNQYIIDLLSNNNIASPDELESVDIANKILNDINNA